MDKKTNSKIILLFIVVGIILFSVLFIKVYNDFIKDNSAQKQISSIEYYGYTLNSNDTDLYKSYYKELDKVLKEKQVDYRSYASLLSKLFIVDVYSLNNKLASTDIGGLEFIHPDLKENFKENMSETLYKYVESNIDGKRTQELPIVKEIKVDNVFETKYTYNDTEYDAYASKYKTYFKDLCKNIMKAKKVKFNDSSKVIEIIDANTGLGPTPEKAYAYTMAVLFALHGIKNALHYKDLAARY